MLLSRLHETLQPISRADSTFEDTQQPKLEAEQQEYTSDRRHGNLCSRPGHIGFDDASSTAYHLSLGTHIQSRLTQRLSSQLLLPLLSQYSIYTQSKWTK